MYQIVALISAIIRNYYLPNPYTTWILDPTYANVFNMLVGGIILHITSWLLCKCAYYKGIDDPAKGSFGYLISYILLTFIITMLGKLGINYKIEILIFVVIYLSLCIITAIVFKKDKLVL